ncbi:S9 family peptidase [Psychrobium sp. 1_MG-2023]|uniref:S9 family peptidase n=1 Tax=Psychrobium sp. 1_MG-2023 TaxID=3062624 RepID=UPI000C33D337|nr:S9 family peptidase [Psychrobium sp. 1_MG-2023]MDP2562297.1 prolyl oligopeptidase family serine peptidase [Psychrobium sp. 1_MG-2023]PKF54680.1 S9 family peptidase [Alteromonadales bacterium alter-6D02]
MNFKKTLIAATFAGLLTSGLTGCTLLQQSPATTSMEQTQQAALIPLEQFFTSNETTKLHVSSDGQWVAFTKEHLGTANIFIMPKGAHPDQAQPLTQSKEPIQTFFWSANGNELFFAKDIGGSENTQIYRVSFEANESTNQLVNTTVTALTNNNKVRYILSQQVRNDANKLAIFANHDKPSRLDGYTLDINSKVLTRKLINNNNFQSAHFDKQGQVVLGVAMNPDNSRELFSRVNQQWHSVIKSLPGEAIDIVAYNGEKKLAFIKASIEGRDKQELLSLDLNTLSFTTLHRDPNNESDVHSAIFSDDGTPLSVSYYGGRLRTYPLDATFASHWQKINQHFKHDVEITITKRNEKTGAWQLHVASDVEAGTDYIYQATTGEVSVLATQTPSIQPELLSKRQSITYQARDGETIQAYLTLPKGEKTNLPTIVLPHGGPWARVHWTLKSDTFNPVAQLLANRGYAVLQPNFRASTGFGKRFLNLGDKNWGTGTMQHDLTDGANFLVEQGIADKERLGIMGGSYGGYASLAGATFTPDMYKAVISFCGPSSLSTLMDAFPDWARPYLGTWFSAVGDTKIPSELADMQARSPINFIDQITAPVLLIQGANDVRVTQQESDNIAKEMAAKGLPVEYILAKDEGHGFKKSNNMLAAMFAMEQFFGKHLGGRVSQHTNVEVREHLESLTQDVKSL